MLQGCAAVTHELRNPGGYSGHLLDQHMFDSSRSKKLALLRSAIIIAMAARMSNGTIHNPDEADGVAHYLRSATDEMNFAAADIYPVANGAIPCEANDSLYRRNMPEANAADEIKIIRSLADQAREAAKSAASSAQVAHQSEIDGRASANSAQAAATQAWQDVRIVQGLAAAPAVVPVTLAPPPPAIPTPPQCSGYYVNFESEMPLLEGRIVRLMFATLPQDKIKSFAEDVEQGNVLGGAISALKILAAGAKGLHFAAGTYRSGEETVVANLPPAKRDQCRNNRDESTMTVWDAVDCLGLDHETLFGPHPNELKGENLRIDIDLNSFRAVLAIARTSCFRLPLGAANADDTALKNARERRVVECMGIDFKPTWRPGQ
jgi:hypothetical protein